jgi:hypothetical protein
MKASPLILMVCGLSAMSLARANPAGVGVTLKVSDAKPVLNTGETEQEEPVDVFPRIAYAGESKDDVLRIKPRLNFGNNKTDYLALLGSGKVVEPIQNGGTEYDVFFPAIDVRVVNNGKSALHLSRADIRVKESKPDLTPLPMIFGGYDEVQYIRLVNEGWGRIEKAEFEFDLLDKRPKGPPKGELPFKRVLNRVTENAELGLSEELAKKGVSPEVIAMAKIYRENERAMYDAAMAEKDTTALEEENLKLHAKFCAMGSACGPFWKGKDEYGQPSTSCWLHGWLTVSWLVGSETKTLRFPIATDVLVIPPDGLGAGEPVTGRYEAMLQKEGKDYTLQVPVSQVVKPGGVSRFTITLGVPQTGQHEFEVRFVNADGDAIEGGKVLLDGFLPRGAVSALKNAAQTPEE